MKRSSQARHKAGAALISKHAVRGGRGRRGPRAGAVPVFLVEDNRLLRDGLATILGAQGLDVVATARDGAAALRQVKRLKPRVVLLDAALGDRDSLRLVAAMHESSPATRVIVMQLLPAQEDIVAFVRAGVSGFITKDASVSEFAATIRAVAAGGNVLPPRLAATLFSHVALAVTPGMPARKRKSRPR